jgi:hypothetical protein
MALTVCEFMQRKDTLFFWAWKCVTNAHSTYYYYYYNYYYYYLCGSNSKNRNEYTIGGRYITLTNRWLASVIQQYIQLDR